MIKKSFKNKYRYNDYFYKKINKKKKNYFFCLNQFQYIYYGFFFSNPQTDI